MRHYVMCKTKQECDFEFQDTLNSHYFFERAFFFVETLKVLKSQGAQGLYGNLQVISVFTDL